MKKRFMAILLCMILVLAAVPGSVFAANETNTLGITFSVKDPETLTTSSSDQEVTVELKPSESVVVNGVSYVVNFPEGWSVKSITCTNSDINITDDDINYELSATSAKLSWSQSSLQNKNTDTLGTITLVVPGGTAAGSYECSITKMLFSHYNDDNKLVKWENGATASFTVTLEEPVLPEATLPTAVEDLEYTGEPLTGVPAGEGYTIDGNVQIDAGSYTATVTLEDGYVWADGSTEKVRTVEWSIAPKAVSVPEGKDLTYNGDDQIGVEAGEGYTLEGNVQKNAGSYTATATLESANYVWAGQEGENATSPKTIAWTIGRKVIEDPKPAELTYTGEELTGVEDGEGYTVEAGGKGTNAGNYTAELKADDNYEFSNGTQNMTVDWTIAPAETLGDKDVTAAVGDDVTEDVLPKEDLGEGTVILVEVVENDGAIEFDEETGTFKAVQEGTAKIKVTYDGATNYEDGEYIVTITVTNAAPTGDMTGRWIMVGAAALMIMVVYLFVSKKREEE